MRWSLILAQFDYELKFRSTKEHCNAVMLSRLPTTVKNELLVDNMINSLQIDTLPVTSTEIQTKTSKAKTFLNVLSYFKVVNDQIKLVAI